MRIVHLSDIHLSKSNLSDFKRFYLKALLNDLKKWDEITPINLLIITGDLIDKGGSSFDKGLGYFTFYNEVILPIQAALGLNNEQIFFIPGNHDIDETKLESLTESGFLARYNTIEDINAFVDDNKLKSHPLLDRNSEYKDFEKDFTSKHLRSYVTNFESCFVCSVNDKSIGIAAFNSAWRCSTKLPSDKLYFGTNQITNASNFFVENNTDFNIALIHHPIEEISSIERYEINTLLQTFNFNIVLSGHTHKGNIFIVESPSGRLFTNVAKSGFSNPREKVEDYKSGYAIIDISFSNNNETNIECNFRKYIHSRIAFDKDVDIANDGTYKTLINLNKIDETLNVYIKLADKTCRAKLDSINNTLLTSGTDSVAPCDINNLFVLPRLTSSPSGYKVSDNEIRNYDINYILSIDKNILIVGDRETGKTTLLNKLFVEASTDFLQYDKVAVKLDFNELIKKDIKPLIKDFLNEPNSDFVEQLLIDGNILLLIDNLYNEENYVHAKSRLKRFIKSYPKNKYIIATSSSIEELVTAESAPFNASFITDAKAKEFETIFIGSVGVKEFKSLATKWFQNSSSDWFQNNLEKLIKVFEILKIPRTFFSVSLFLWIIEKQENFKPVNKANLVNQFLIYILEGLKHDNNKAGSYNFDKKVELLSEIALEMHASGDKSDSYCLKDQDVVNVIQTNFNLNQLRLNASDKCREFVEKGLLKVDPIEGNVKFRYEAFFQFFLSINIDTNEEFKEFVFEKNNFLSFINELDYYTGRKRTDSTVLLMSMERLKLAYEDIDGIIRDKVDQYFPNESFFLKHIQPKDLLPKTRKRQLSEEQVEEALGEQLEMLPINDSIRVKRTHSMKLEFFKVLELTSKVLKNSENIKNPDLINESLDLIITKTAKYGIFLQSILANSLEKNEDEELPVPSEMLITLGPLISQLYLLNWIGTDFLEIPVELKLKKYLSSQKKDISEFELFLVGFLYADMKFHNFIEYLDRVIDKIDNKFMCELFFMKIFSYYIFRSSNSPLLPHYERHMITLLSKARNISKSRARQIVAGRIKSEKNKIEGQIKIDLN